MTSEQWCSRPPVPLIETEAELEDVLSKPAPDVIHAVSQLDGDVLILGIGGKMGPTLSKLVKRAIDEAGVHKKAIGVSRFSSAGLQEELNATGIETITCDLLDSSALQRLPDVANIIFMAGMKFGSTGNESLTWAMNTILPGMVAHQYRYSRIIVFSTGNVYPLTPVALGGASETDPPCPVGEYAQSCLGRERIFEHFSRQFGTPVTIIRLNYAIDLRYGVLLDIAQKVHRGEAIDLTTGHVNVIWQGDANSVVLRAFSICGSPPTILNVTGPETVSVRWVATRFASIFGIEPVLRGTEAETALLSNASLCHNLFGYPTVTLEQMIRWIAQWVVIDGPTLDKPTHFEERKGRF